MCQNLPSFLAQVTEKYAAVAAPHTVSLSGSASWVAGKVAEQGTATLQASTDGSSSMSLSLASTSQREVRTAWGQDRSCTWFDNKATSHDVNLTDCMEAVPWFAPMLFVQPLPSLPFSWRIADEGLLTRKGSTYRSITFASLLNVKGGIGAAFSTETEMHVLFDPNSLEPTSVEYVQHAERDSNVKFRMRVEYSDYRLVEGIPVPFHIDRYVNDSLQL